MRALHVMSLSKYHISISSMELLELLDASDKTLFKTTSTQNNNDLDTLIVLPEL